MNEAILSPWEFVLLALAAFRVWKLIADDEILDRPRDWIIERIDLGRGQTKWQDFIICPWCAGFWISGLMLAIYLATLGSWPDSVGAGVADVGVWFALSAAVGLLARLLPD